jgi:[ribosomal protein S18]-alanine N-acetyltransferase
MNCGGPHQDHVDRIMAVMDRSFDPAFGEAWSRAQLLGSLALPYCNYHLLDAKGQPPGSDSPAAGFYLSRTGFDEEELLLLAVHPKMRRRGIATLLLEDLAQAARQRGAKRLLLEMRKGNPAEFLYRNWGFKPIGIRPKYYRGADDTLIDAITFEKII